LALALSLAACASGASTAPAEEQLVPQPPLRVSAQERVDAPPPAAPYEAGDAETSPPPSAPPPSSGCTLPAGALSFQQAKRPEQQLPALCVPAWTREQLAQGFAAVRDTRWLEWSERPGSLRRIPWLSANNGCEERALTAKYLLQEEGYPEPWYARAKNIDPKSLFTMQTENEPGGVVRWGGHVAPVVRVEGELIVLDPAIEPSRPLRLAEWLGRFSTPAQRDVALCRDHEEMDGCMDAEPRVLDGPDEGIDIRLGEEWRVQELLGRDPYRVLGECPPWASCPDREPPADPERPPTVTRLASDQFTDFLTIPLFILGDNFIPGVTSVRIVGDSRDEYAEIGSINLRSIRLDDEYLSSRGFEAGTYQLFVANGELSAPPLTLTLPL
jgi:hypothetical protein